MPRRLRSLLIALACLIVIGAVAAVPVITSGTLLPSWKVTLDPPVGGLLTYGTAVSQRQVLETDSGRYLAVRNGHELVLLDLDRGRTLLRTRVNEYSVAIRLDPAGRYAFVVTHPGGDSTTTAYTIDGSKLLWTKPGDVLGASDDVAVVGSWGGKDSSPHGVKIETGQLVWKSPADLGRYITSEPPQDGIMRNGEPEEDSSVLPTIAVTGDRNSYQVVSPATGAPVGKPFSIADEVRWTFRRAGDQTVAISSPPSDAPATTPELRLLGSDGKLISTRELPPEVKDWHVIGNRLIGDTFRDSWIAGQLDTLTWTKITEPDSIRHSTMQFTSEVMVAQTAANKITAISLTDGDVAWTYQQDVAEEKLEIRADADTVIVQGGRFLNPYVKDGGRFDLLDATTGRHIARVVLARPSSNFLVGLGHGDAIFSRTIRGGKVRIQPLGWTARWPG